MPAKTAEVLQPSKFLLLVLQLVAFSVIFNVKSQHILGKAVPVRLGEGSEIFESANRFLLFWFAIAVICLILELFIIFCGATLFNDKFNIMVLGTHAVGLFITIQFLANADTDESQSAGFLVSGHYESVRTISIVGAVAPLAIELANLLSAKMNYRTQMVL